MSLLRNAVSRVAVGVAGRHFGQGAVRAVGLRNGVQEVAPLVMGLRSLFVDAAALTEAAGNPKEAASNFTAALEKELKFENENYKGPTEDIAHFVKNSKFTIEDVKGSREVYLRSKLDNEEINITFGVLDPDLADSEGADDDEPALPVPFTVCISKEEAGKDLGTMTLQCHAYSGQVDVVSLNFNGSSDAATGRTSDDVSSRDAAYPGPKLSDLDETLKNSMVDYLASRGIDDNLGAFIESMYFDKEQREYMNWLSELTGFVKK